MKSAPEPDNADSTARASTSVRARPTPSDLIVAVSQPTFLPWLGWFDIVDQVDLFVILDDVGFSKQSWQQRNRIVTPAGLTWVTVPVRTAGRLGQRIIDAELANSACTSSILELIARHYNRARHCGDYLPGLRDAMRDGAASGLLVDLNLRLISWMLDCLGVSTPCVRATELGVEGKRGEYVAGLCERLGASRYLAAPGSEAYLIEDREAFSRRSIEVLVHCYQHPTYTQCYEPFLPYASALDAILNEGPAAPSVMRSGRRPPRPLGATAIEVVT